MASIRRRRKRDGSASWDATVRIVGYPTVCQSFPTKLEAGLWATRIEAAAKGRTLALARDMTFAHLVDEVMPKLVHPVAAAFAYWREQLGDLRLIDVTPQLIATHRDRLLGAPSSGFGHRRCKPRSAPTVRNYLLELSRLFSVAMRELRVCESNPVSLGIPSRHSLHRHVGYLPHRAADFDDRTRSTCMSASTSSART